MRVLIEPIYFDLETLAAALSVSESTVQALVRDDKTFPRQRQISQRRVGWLRREVLEWAESRPISALLPPENTGSKKLRSVTQDNRRAF